MLAPYHKIEILENCVRGVAALREAVPSKAGYEGRYAQHGAVVRHLLHAGAPARVASAQQAAEELVEWRVTTSTSRCT